ncbi:MAG: ATP-binding protein [Candidatus Thiodiazotropha lotti]|nr:ATP-binding protein [Candidatus Thiodiazotropha lotti]MCW4195287.1 ATP-binding protein [Candidatus Thiodiazotropha lotti]MCW4199561.1 ATP-binding protein [Candidatus Thiodiazotropha lotti]
MILELYGKKATLGCPCGLPGDSSNCCHCSTEQISRHRNHISGPLLDHIDIHVEVPRQPIPIGGTQSSNQEEGSDIETHIRIDKPG